MKHILKATLSGILISISLVFILNLTPYLIGFLNNLIVGFESLFFKGIRGIQYRHYPVAFTLFFALIITLAGVVFNGFLSHKHKKVVKNFDNPRTSHSFSRHKLIFSKIMDRKRSWFGVIMVVALIWLSWFIPFIAIGKIIVGNCLPFSFLIVILVMQFALRIRVYKKLTWKKLADLIFKWNGASVISVSGFGFIATNDSVQNDLLKITTDPNLINLHTMETIYYILVFIFVAAILVYVVGRLLSDSEKEKTPNLWFFPSFILGWISFTGCLSIVLSSLILTFHAHISSMP